MKKFLTALALGLLFPFSALAVNITIPSSPSWGMIPRGNANGTYTPVATSTLGLTFSTTSTDYWFTQQSISGGSWATSSSNFYNSLFRDWKVDTTGALVPSTTRSVLINSASSTITNLQVVNGTTTNATSTNLSVTNINGGTLSGNNSGDQVGDGSTITGAGTIGDPFVSHAVGGGSWATTSTDYWYTQKQNWSINAAGNLIPTTTRGILISVATSTIANFTSVNSTSTNATTTNAVMTNATTSNFTITGVTSALDLSGTDGKISAFGGSNCGANTKATSISATGVLTCSAVANTDMTNSSINLTYTGGISGGSSVALGGTLALTAWGTTSQDWWYTTHQNWSINAAGNLTPTSTRGILISSATSTIANLAMINSTTTNATTTNYIGTYSTTTNEVNTNATTSTFAITGAASNCNGTSALTTTSTGVVNCTAQPQGTVTAVSVASSNGFAGTSGGGATPILTLTTSVTGVLKGNATAISAASNGTDYTLITALTCSGTDKVSAITAAGVITCSADVSGGGASTEKWATTTGQFSIQPNTGAGIISTNSTTTWATTTYEVHTYATTSQLAITGVGTCTAGQALKPSATAGLSCQAVTASASAGGLNTQFQFNDSTAISGTDGMVYQKTTGRITIGDNVTDPFEYLLLVSTTTGPQFEVASGTQDIFVALSTTTAFDQIGGEKSSNVRVGIGTSTKNVSQDQLYVDGRINTGDWIYSECTAPAINRSTAVVTDAGLSLGSVTTGFACGSAWGYDRSANGRVQFIVTDPVGGYVSLEPGATGAAGATVAGDGQAMRPFNSYLKFATNTPAVEARVRLAAVQFSSSSVTTIGFGNYTISTTAGAGAFGFAYPTNGCWLTASSTQANWMAVCTNGSNATTTVNTGVATTSVTTGTPVGRFQDLRVEVSSTTANFYIVTPRFPIASSSIPVATITTNIPLTTVMTPIVSIGVKTPNSAANASALQVRRTKLWWKEPLQ